MYKPWAPTNARNYPCWIAPRGVVLMLWVPLLSLFACIDRAIALITLLLRLQSTTRPSSLDRSGSLEQTACGWPLPQCPLLLMPMVFGCDNRSRSGGAWIFRWRPVPVLVRTAGGQPLRPGTIGMMVVYLVTTVCIVAVVTDVFNFNNSNLLLCKVTIKLY